MSNIIQNLLCGALGYAVGSHITNDDVKRIIDAYLKAVTYDDLIRDYSQFHELPNCRQETIEEKCQYGMDMHYF